MEFLKKALKKIREFVSSNLIFSNDEEFDEDFYRLFQISYFLGFYHPKRSIKRIIYGYFVLTIGMTSVVSGLVKDTIESSRESDVHRFVTSISYVAMLTSFMGMTITFINKSSDIFNLTKAFHSMHKGEDEKPLIVYRKKCKQIVRFYLSYLIVAITTIMVAFLFGFKFFKLAAPTIIDIYANGFLHEPLVVLSMLQAYIIGLHCVVSDLLHILFMVRAGANFEMLSIKLRNCTTNKDPNLNEKELIACVKYHQRILE